MGFGIAGFQRKSRRALGRACGRQVVERRVGKVMHLRHMRYWSWNGHLPGCNRSGAQDVGCRALLRPGSSSGGELCPCWLVSHVTCRMFGALLRFRRPGLRAAVAMVCQRVRASKSHALITIVLSPEPSSPDPACTGNRTQGPCCLWSIMQRAAQGR